MCAGSLTVFTQPLCAIADINICAHKIPNTGSHATYHWRELPKVSFLSRQTCVCRNRTVFCRVKSMLVATNTYACRDKHNFVATKVFSRQAYFCRDERRVFVGLCFVATKMILVAAPATDSNHGVDLRKILQTL